MELFKASQQWSTRPDDEKFNDIQTAYEQSLAYANSSREKANVDPATLRVEAYNSVCIRHRDQWYPGEHDGILPLSLWDRVQTQLNSNLTRRRNRVREQASSLLTGWVEDEHGTRYTPSFTVRRGRRYRYYVSQLAIKNMATEKNGLTRVPAQELENRVMEKLAAFLKSDSDVFDGLNLADENPAVASRLVTAAKQLAARLTSLSSQDLRDLLASFLWRITLHENKIEIKIGRAELRKQLESGGKSVSASVPAKNSVLSSDWIGLTVEGQEKTVRRRSSSRGAAQLQRVARASEAPLDQGCCASSRLV